MVEDILAAAEQEMKKATEALQHNLAGIRTGRASTALVDNLPVEVYGMTMPLKQLAGVSVPESRLIVIQPYDASTMKAIERAIQMSELGINPSSDGKVIRLGVPPLTEERRRELIKQVRARVEEFKVSLRNHRRAALDDLRELEHEKLIGEDELRRAQDKLQQITDRYTEELDQIGTAKEAEVLKV